MAKEFEQLEAQRRIEFLKNQEQARELHNSATKLCLLYRSTKAKRLVSEKRMQMGLEAILKQNTDTEKRWIPVQKLARQTATRIYFAERGIKYKLNRKRKKKRVLKDGKMPDGTDMMSPEDLQKRINYEVQQRRIMERMNLFEQMLESYATVIQVCAIICIIVCRILQRYIIAIYIYMYTFIYLLDFDIYMF